MASTQPEALRLASALQQQAVWEGHYGPSYLRDLLPEAATELRRLYAVNKKLIDTLEEIRDNSPDPTDQSFARYVLKKVEEL